MSRGEIEYFADSGTARTIIKNINFFSGYFALQINCGNDDWFLPWDSEEASTHFLSPNDTYICHSYSAYRQNQRNLA